MVEDTQGKNFKKWSAINEADVERVSVIQLQVGVDVKTEVGFNVTAERVDDILVTL